MRTLLRSFFDSLGPAALALLLLLGAAPAALAHPHMFFDAKAAFVFDDKGRVAAIRIAYVVDELNSLYTLTELELDQDGDGALTDAEAKLLAKQMVTGLSDFAFFVDLKTADGAVKLNPPSQANAKVANGMIGASFDLPLEKPLDPKTAPLLLRLYDPTYYVEVTLAGPPDLAGAAPKHCAVAHSQPDLEAELAKLREVLANLDKTETPEDATIGATFADKSWLRCRTSP